MKRNPVLLTLLLISFFLLPPLLLAQPDELWVVHYNGPGNDFDFAWALVVDDLGNVYVTGESNGANTLKDYATIKYNAQGIQQWVARYNGPGNLFDNATELVLDDSGNVYVTGSSIGSGTLFDYATIKYNAAGIQQWVARYNGPGNDDDIAHAIAIDDAGNVYVTGESWGVGTSDDYATIKYNAAGVQQWVVRYIGPGNDNDFATALVLDDAGNVYVTGGSVGRGTDYDYATIKYNASGVEQWVTRYSGPGAADYAYGLAIDNAGNTYVTGYSDGSGIDIDYATIKYNAAGVEQWVRRYNGPGNDYDFATALVIDDAANVYVTGYSYGLGTDYDYATIKYNATGVQQWVARYNGPGDQYDNATALAIDHSGNVYVTGESAGDYATIKYDAAGVELWATQHNGGGVFADHGQALAVDDAGNVYVTGSSCCPSNSDDYTTIKYGGFQIPCDEIDLFASKCDVNGSGRAMVRLLNSTEYAGETVEFQLDGTVYPVELIANGTHTIGRLEVPLVGYGEHTMTLTNPAGCYDPITFNCQVDGATADPEFDAAWAEFDALEASLTDAGPSKVRLIGNYPNPFNPVTTISYELPVNTYVTLTISDVVGREVARPVDGSQKAGYKSVTFDGNNLASGIYFYRLRAGSFVETKKLVLMK